MKKLNICFIYITSILLLLVGCTSIDKPIDDIDDATDEPDTSKKEYHVDYVLFDNEVIHKTYEEGEANEFPEVLYVLISDNTDYQFIGWDYTNDGIVDRANFNVHADMTCYAIYTMPKEITITYLCDGETKSIITGNNELFTLDVPTEKENFLYYQDENGYPYTDKKGNKLKCVDLRKSITLTPFFLEKENLPCEVYISTFPTMRVKGEEEQKLIKAIEENKVTVSTFDENKITFDGVDYQRVVTQNKGNIFRDYTRCEYGETYYFRYTPFKWYIYNFEFSGEDIVYSGVTCDIVNYHKPASKQEFNLGGALEVYVESSPSDVLTHQLKGFYPIGFRASGYIFQRVPNDNLIINKVKETSDYVIAAMPIEISYEKGTMFHICYSIGDVVNNLSQTEEIYINDYLGERQIVKSGEYYGELLECKFLA